MLSRLLLTGNLPRNISKHRNALQQINAGRFSSNKAAQDARPLTNISDVITSPEIVNLAECKYSEGKEYYGFQCTRTEHVPEFGLMSYTFRHLTTGTEFWYLDRKDVNNVFSVNFRTTPFDSTGLPHILEHSVLCGSNKYPVRDPFFKMLTRSVATFMNAMTGPDYTIYPFSSMNETDFRNLQKIYLDAVFRPNLEYLDFLQEGWRLEHSDLRNKESEYVLKGVVYNEMKGAFSDNSSIFGQNLLNNLLPNHTYGYVSGGNPLEIPKLTHTNLVDFHAKYYHPSNARIYCYGSFDLNKTLEYVSKEYLCKYDQIDNSYSRIPPQKRWSKSRNVHISCRYDTMGAAFEKQNQIAISLLLSDITNIQETFTLHVLSELMVRGPNAPFYKSLIEPNFSGGYNQTTGYDSQIKDTFFSIGLQDVQVEDFNRVSEIFDNTLKQIIEEGFEHNHVESVLHNIELSLKHQTPQFGLGMLFNTTSLWNHEGDVVQSLFVSQLIAHMRRCLEQEPKFLQSKVEHYFASNEHRLTMTMSPDDHYEDNFKAAELNLLKQKIISLDEEKRERVYLDGLKLEEAQKATPNVDLLPCLSLSDVQEAPKIAPLEVLKIKDVPTQVCNVHTNDISYMKLFFDCNGLKPDEVLLIPLFCNVITEMGTEHYDYREFDKVVTSKTGGFNFRLHMADNIYDSQTYDVGLLMSTHALDKHTSDMFELCNEQLLHFRFKDTQRLAMLVDSYVSNMSVGIANSGHLYAMQSCAGLVSSSAKLRSQLAGVEHIEYMKRYVKENSIDEIRRYLRDLGFKMFNRKHLRVAINTSKEFYAQFVQSYEEFIGKLPAAGGRTMEHKVQLLQPTCQHYVMNVPVNFCAKAFHTVPYTHRDHPTLRVLAKMLSAKYLLPVVREQNGAYGAGAKLSSDGMFSFFSYRDPNSVKTLEVFDHTHDWLVQQLNKEDEQALFEAKLGVLQQLDAPVAPGNIGNDFFLYGVSQEMSLNYRARLLSISNNMLQEVVEKYFKDTPAHYGKVILGPENKTLEQDTGLKWQVVV